MLVGGLINKVPDVAVVSGTITYAGVKLVTNNNELSIRIELVKNCCSGPIKFNFAPTVYS